MGPTLDIKLKHLDRNREHEEEVVYTEVDSGDDSTDSDLDRPDSERYPSLEDSVYGTDLAGE